ncbi:MAG: thioredoxin domain-containing protein, partial [Candidatus Kapaibacterium sp.]
MNSNDKPAYSNRLASESSPYLLQHANNPVDWYPWGDEAFEAARVQDKPIFLSIGYSTCHWCHVMERESFENKEIARMMNETFINIKVDREERPDIDSIYMSVCQMLTGGGGWPLTILMTPDRRPFFAGTYFPPDSLPGRIGVLELCRRVKNLWQFQRDDLMNSAEQITARLREEPAGASQSLGIETIQDAFLELKKSYDEKRGGFGTEPKFPSPQNFRLLARYTDRTDDPQATEMAANTILKMRDGGIWDQIGGGFHRYSTDPKWLVPHFEKMLYDQAWMMIASAELYQATGDDSFAEIIAGIDRYVSRDLQSGEGIYYSAEDADSEGIEGKFYVWNASEIIAALGDDADLAMDYYNIKPDGNFFPEHGQELRGGNILHRSGNAEELREKFNLNKNEFSEKIDSINHKLFEIREKRVRPGLDDKALTDWNAMMIAAYAIAGRATEKGDYIYKARKAYEFIKSTMRTPDGLLHRWRRGEAGIDAMLDDYAFLIFALTELYEATYEPSYLSDALELMSEMNDRFLDRGNGGYYNSAAGARDLIARRKDIYDGAIPSGNSINITNLVRLARLTGRRELEAIAQRNLDAFSAQIANYPAGFAEMLCGLDFVLGPSHEVVIAGAPD